MARRHAVAMLTPDSDADAVTEPVGRVAAWQQCARVPLAITLGVTGIRVGELRRARYAGYKDEWLWEASRWWGDIELPALSAIAGGADHWVAAGGEDLFIQRDSLAETTVLGDDRDATRKRAAHGLFAPSVGRFFAVGDSIHLEDPDPYSGVRVSPIEACDYTGCALETIQSGHETTPLRAVWGDDAGTVMAVGDGIIVRRNDK